MKTKYFAILWKNQSKDQIPLDIIKADNLKSAYKKFVKEIEIKEMKGV